ncbi:MAG: hypothetical protein IPH20_20870 [Bacteroidales bacterium]|nr:hypothetical protein [Bacteroidales bacterium]
MAIGSWQLAKESKKFKGSRVQGFKGSRVQRKLAVGSWQLAKKVKSLKVQEFKGSKVQEFKESWQLVWLAEVFCKVQLS